MSFAQWKVDAKEYWRKFRPQYYASLEKSGQVEEAVNQAAEWTEEALEKLLQRGLKYHEAWEMLREEWLFPPGDEDESPPADPDDLP